jgi:hypothetical protein
LRLLWAIACRSYEIRDDGTASIEGAGADTVWVPTLPIEVSLLLLLRLGLLEGEEASLEIQLLDPRMTLLGTLGDRLTGTPGPSHIPGSEIPRLQPVLLRLTAETEGIYGAEISSDGRVKDSVYFRVRVGSPS